MHLAFLIVPIKGDANVAFACPVGGYFVVIFECFLDVECMLLTFVLDAKIIHYQRELDGASVVFP